MKVENGKIVEATEEELFEYFLSREFDDIMDFNAFLEGCRKAGTKVGEMR